MLRPTGPQARSRNVAGRWGVRRKEGGQALVETVLVLPVLLVLVLAIIDFGITWTHYEALTEAVRVAGRAQTVCRFGGSPASAFSGAATNVPGASSSIPGCPSSAGAQSTVSGSAPYSIRIFGVSVISGTLSSSVTVTVE
jgi:hypothetical protein